MFKEFKGERVTVIISSRGDNLLEYTGLLLEEYDDSILMSDVDISYLILNIQKGFFGGNMNQYKENLSRVVINKKYIISCGKQ
ncbi:MAG: hypothetical protein ACOX1L_01650 [Erysipelotrichaceae bacterium]|jgi:hypothetical protein